MAIAFDNAATICTAAASPASGTITTSGSNVDVVVVVNTVSGGGAPTSVTVGGVTANLVDSLTTVGGVGDTFSYVAMNVGAGTKTVTITKTSATFWAVAASYTSTSATGQPDAHGSATVASSTNTSLAVTTSGTSGCWLIEGGASSNGGIQTAGSGTTIRVSNASGLFIGDSNGTVATSSSVSLNFVNGSGAASNTVILGMTLAPGSAAATTNPGFLIRMANAL